MPAKIIIKERIKYDSYFEVNYGLILVTPVGMVGKGDPIFGATITKTGTCSCEQGTTANAVKAKLIALYNAEQIILNADTTYTFYGTTWDGSVWV